MTSPPTTMSKPRRIKRAINGVLLLDKPAGFSSNQALQRVRWVYQAEKGGHTGNLDPIATGLLPICLGEATKFSQRLLDADKAYRAEIRLGATTTTGDTEGEVLSTSPLRPSLSDLRLAVAKLCGDILQVPPMHSALKFQGRALYEYARAGIDIPREARPVTIYRADIVSFSGDTLVLDVDCSKGTYIRVLAEDLGRDLGCGAHLTGLRRTRTAGFALADAVTIETLDQLDPAARDALLLPTDALLRDLPEYRLDADSSYYFRNGNPVWVPRLQCQGGVRVYAADGAFLGLAEVDDQGRLAPRRLLYTGES